MIPPCRPDSTAARFSSGCWTPARPLPSKVDHQLSPCIGSRGFFRLFIQRSLCLANLKLTAGGATDSRVPCLLRARSHLDWRRPARIDARRGSQRRSARKAAPLARPKHRARLPSGSCGAARRTGCCDGCDRRADETADCRIQFSRVEHSHGRHSAAYVSASPRKMSICKRFAGPRQPGDASLQAVVPTTNVNRERLGARRSTRYPVAVPIP